MKRVLITGMSGNGRSTVIRALDGLGASNTDGSTKIFAGCYTLHLGSPNATPPFQPLGVQSAKVAQAPTGSNPTELGLSVGL